MARESSLWKWLKVGKHELAVRGTPIDLYRLENAIGVGHPDCEGCLRGAQIWIELKSEDRPKRSTSVIRFKLRPSQHIWHTRRAAAGCRHNWVLLQVGEGREASRYLIPGSFYDRLGVTEAELEVMSFVKPGASAADVLTQAALGW